ncbi:hypothetical protein NA57DRAFT_72006 [Rhizodiscina lignyota]|uniref:GPI anchored serine-threonine rich protein n=1 Tax=Rhizodiscina lignyota TaxID=1504668 RepID=A0A9P4IN74_9PEZI|nr:hypothetical protein NA57DRAFT_72006 [Rhizodiscina lignyota]
MFTSRIVALCALLSASTAFTMDGVQWNARISNALDKRQGSSQNEKQGSNCTEAFGAGYETCRPASASEIRLCYNPSIGQICCQNEWGCPSDSFCLIKDFCCPTGIDPSACAAHYSVSIPSNLATYGTGPAPSTSSSSESTTILSTIVTSTPISTITIPTSTNSSSADAAAAAATSTSSALPVPYPAGNASATHGYIGSTGVSGSGFLASATGSVFPSGTVSGGGSAATSPIVFEGAATMLAGGSWVATVLGVVAAVVGLI